MKLVIDFETRGRIDLRKCGMYKYAEDKATEIQCLGVLEVGKPPVLWLPPTKRHLAAGMNLPTISDEVLRNMLDAATEIKAQNCGFERVIWRECMAPLWGYPDLPLHKLRCTAAQAAAVGLPRHLDGAGSVLNLKVQKDPIGYKAMLRLCKPDKNDVFPEDKESLAILYRYCMKDCEAEAALSAALPSLSQDEQAIWELDQRINDRGLPVDTETALYVIDLLNEYEEELLKEVVQLSGGKFTSVRQRDKVMEWLEEQDCKLKALRKKNVADALNTELKPEVRRLLEIRQTLSKSSVAKFQSLLNWCCADGRLRGCFMYAGANTGRWTAHGFQPHNLPRDSFGEATDEVIRAVESEPVDFFRLMYGDPFTAASKLIRPMVKSDRLVWADLAAIEARVNAWLAVENWKIEAFKAFDAKTGPDLYKLAYSKSFGVPIESVDDGQRQIGKVMELALGYQGGKNAFTAMGAGYGLYVSEEVAQDLVTKWRAANQDIVKFWYALDDAAIMTVKTRNPHNVGFVRWAMNGAHLTCRLPSGRLLWYQSAAIEMQKTPWGEERQAVTYCTSVQKSWTRVPCYGGLFCENIVQAASRDILAWGMLRVEAAGHGVIGHVHDEVITESDATPKELARIMATPPSWAPGLPLAAKGSSGGRYVK